MKKITLLILLVLSLSSCTHYYYIPNTKNVPLFRKSQEYRFSAATGGGETINNVDFQGAYAITDNIAVMSNYMKAKAGNKTEESWGEGRYFESAVGYYKPVFKKAVVEVYGGAGFSNQYHEYDGRNNMYNPSNPVSNGIATFSDLSYNKLFIQPSFGFNTVYFDIAYTLGFSRVNFHKVSHNIYKEYSEYSIVQEIANNKTVYLLEDAVTLRVGWKYIKLQLQFQNVRQLSKPEFQFEKSAGSLGLMFSFAKWYR
jgi:hypothetical protein